MSLKWRQKSRRKRGLLWAQFVEHFTHESYFHTLLRIISAARWRGARRRENSRSLAPAPATRLNYEAKDDAGQTAACCRNERQLAFSCSRLASLVLLHPIFTAARSVAQPGGGARPPPPEIGFTRKFLAAPLS